MVLLSTKNMRLVQGGTRKLLPRFVGPFRVVKVVNPVVVKLDLPAGLKMHNVFHVSLLRHYREGTDCKAPPLPLVIKGQLEYEVEHIVDHKSSKNGTKYLIRWKGYTAVDDTWEPEKNLANCQEVLKEYQKAAST